MTLIFHSNNSVHATVRELKSLSRWKETLLGRIWLVFEPGFAASIEESVAHTPGFPWRSFCSGSAPWLFRALVQPGSPSLLSCCLFSPTSAEKAGAPFL